MERVKELYQGLLDGSLCREHPAAVWGTSIVVAGGIYCLASAALRKSIEPTKFQAAFQEKPISASSDVHRVQNKSSDISKAAQTLGAAMAASPLTAACAAENLEGDALRNATTWLYRTILKASVPVESGSIVLSTNDAQSVAIWYPPGSNFDDKRFIKAGGMWYTIMFSGWQRRLRFPSHGQVVSIRRKTALRKFDNQAYYLLAAGTTGSDADLLSVITPVLQEAAKHGVPAITEADTPARKALLESAGFQAVASTSALQVNVDIMLKAP